MNIMVACNMMSTLLGYIVIYMNADTHTHIHTGISTFNLTELYN